jgi:hypothetical protein
MTDPCDDWSKMPVEKPEEWGSIPRTDANFRASEIRISWKMIPPGC